jgi:hypothetical protein
MGEDHSRTGSVLAFPKGGVVDELAGTMAEPISPVEIWIAAIYLFLSSYEC